MLETDFLKPVTMKQSLPRDLVSMKKIYRTLRLAIDLRSVESLSDRRPVQLVKKLKAT